MAVPVDLPLSDLLTHDVSTPTANAGRRSLTWIVSPSWDLSFVVATPLLIVPVVLILFRHYFTPEQINLVAISFASLGHHLPGFMRAYGDQELFLRYRWRFLLMPPLIFGLALLFSPPDWLARPLGLSWQHLHGFELILLFWGTWHGLMQTYGFMRLYDVRQGINDRLSARLDHTLCLAIFAAGVVFSDARVYGIANTAWKVGLPIINAEALQGLRILVGGMTLALLAIYAWHSWRRTREGAPPNPNKILLLGITGWTFWYAGRLSTNLLIGFAIFEIYHAVQYTALVWVFNRKKVDKSGRNFGWLRFLFQDKWSMLGLYAACIAAFGLIRFLSVDTADYVFRGGELNAHKLLIACMVTSTFLHYYFDGFIWKVSEPQTKKLLSEQGEASPSRLPVSGLVHALKCGVFFVIAGGALALESRKPGDEAEMLPALAELTPRLPELKIQLSRDALESGNVEQAIILAQQAVEIQPDWHVAHGDLAVAFIAAEDWDAARKHAEKAVALAPAQWRYRTNLGLIDWQEGDATAAIAELRIAIRYAPEKVEPRRKLVQYLLAAGHWDEAQQAAAAWSLAHPRSAEPLAWQVTAFLGIGQIEQASTVVEALQAKAAHSAWTAAAVGELALAQGQHEEAENALSQATRRAPANPRFFALLGQVHLAANCPREAAEALQRSVDINPAQGTTWHALGTACFQAKEFEAAATAFERASHFPNVRASALANWGAALLGQDQPAEAESLLRKALRMDGTDPIACRNLAAALRQQGWRDEAMRWEAQAERVQADEENGKVSTSSSPSDR